MALDFFAGCVGGCAGVIVGHPFDTIKVRLQTQDYKNPVYRGTWHCFKTILKNEKVSGLYRGVTSPLGGVSVVNAIVFGVYGNAERLIGSESLRGHVLAGAAAGLVQSVVCGPVELAKTRLQVSNRYKGTWHCIRSILKTEGIRGVSKGLGITVLREVPAFATYFSVYQLLTEGEKDVSTWRMLLAGGLAGSASWVVVYPIDVIKTRIQSDGVDSPPRYRGALDCLKQSYRTEGARFLGRGLTSTMIRAFPTNAVTFTVVSWTMRFGEIAPQTPRPEQTLSLKSVRRLSVHLFEEGSMIM